MSHVVAADGVTSTVKYEIVVTNPNTADAVTYDLADTLGFPAGVTISSATHHRLAGRRDGERSVERRRGHHHRHAASLAGGCHPHLQITVVAVVPAASAATLRVCTDAAGSGFHNGATLVSFGATTAVSACATIAPAQESGGPVPPRRLRPPRSARDRPPSARCPPPVPNCR